MKGLAVLGSGGSIGSYVLNTVRKFPNKFKIISLCVFNNISQLIADALEFLPVAVGISDNNADISMLKTALPKETAIFVGKNALSQCAAVEGTDIVVAASSGTDSIRAVYDAIIAGKKIALANKEVLVSGGEIIMSAAKADQIIPIDSEHSAVFQCLRAGGKKDLKRIVLTASGGAFRGKTFAELKNVTPAQAIKHPNWKMGKKITVDCATMMNKGLEVIEAKRLFNTNNVDYVIHPSSTVHSMVEFLDNSVIAQMGYPSMEIPVQYALSYPDRLISQVNSIDFDGLKLEFYEADEVNFPFPKLAREAYAAGGLIPAVMSAADEKAVELFLKGKIKFTDIYKLVEYSVTKSAYTDTVTLDNIINVDAEIKKYLDAEHNNILR